MVLDRRQLLAGGALVAGGAAIGRFGNAGAAEPVWEALVDDGSGPPARWDHHLAGDAEQQYLLLYGGRDAVGTAFADTWVFDLAAATWAKLDIESPAPRFGCATAEDRNKRRLYLFGGEDGATFYNDTWRFDFKSMTWILQDDGTSTAPTPRYGLGGSLDANDNVVISHGFTFEGRFDDTWVFDTREKFWRDISPAPETRPLRRCLHEMVYNVDTNQIVLFGGCSSGYGPCPQGDLWSFDEVTNVWANITPASGPTARSNPAMVWDKSNSRSLLFGGASEAGAVNDLWQGTFATDGFKWEEIATTGNVPTARSSHDAIELDGAVYMFGGTSPAGVLNDLWKLSL